MKCPYCSRDMNLGYIKAGGEILAWTPEYEKHPWTRWGISRNGVKLGSYSLFGGGKQRLITA